MPTLKVSVVVLATASTEPKMRSSFIIETDSKYVLSHRQLPNFCRPVPVPLLGRVCFYFDPTTAKELCKDLVVADIHV